MGNVQTDDHNDDLYISYTLHEYIFLSGLL